MSNELLQHIKELNAKSQAWVAEDPANRWSSTFTEDLEYWAESGVHTPAQFDRLMLEETLWDCYKAVHGIRPRFMNISQMSNEEIEAELAKLDQAALDDLSSFVEAYPNE